MTLLPFLGAATLHLSWDMNLWYLLPLIVAVSLVYAATRHEEMKPIFFHAARLASWIVLFMVVIMAILWLVTRNL